MSLLLPQTRRGTVKSARAIDIHGDRYVDLVVALNDETAPFAGRVSATECPSDLEPGDPVILRFTMGVITKVIRVEP